MSRRTVDALRAVNRRFYERFAAGFSASREHPWAGWDRLLDAAVPDPEAPLSILDVGCGNARFARFLHSRRAAAAAAPGTVRYLGLDANLALLADAARRPLDGFATTWFAADVLEEAWPLAPVDFDWIVVFGLLHHVPGFAQRAALLDRLARRLRPGGVVLLSVWRFENRPRFAEKCVPWERTPDVDPRELERGDHLLTWGGDGEHPRYCHLIDDDELDRLLAAQPLACRCRFAADGPRGRDNVYAVLG